MCMCIANRNSDNDNRNRFFQSDVSLHHWLHQHCGLHPEPDTKLFCQIQRISSITRIGNHTGIYVTQHRSTLDGCLNHIRFQTGIICRASLKNNCDTGLITCAVTVAPMYTNFFLCCTSTNNIDIQILTGRLCIVLRIAAHPKRQSKLLPTTIRSVGSEYVNVKHPHHWFPDPNPELFHCLFFFETAPTSTVISFISKEPFTLLFCHEMGGLLAVIPEYILRIGCEPRLYVLEYCG